MLRPCLRFFAGVMLVAFIGAQTLCFVHCNFGAGHPDSAPPSCHRGVGCPEKGESDSAPCGASPTVTCFTLKTLLTGDNAPLLVTPQLYTVYTLPPAAFEFEAPLAPELVLWRHAWRCDWALTPEVSLGPAYRALAPPLI